jgi:hypothetical protein
MDAALMARVFFDLQKKSLENFFDAWAISQGLATKAVRIWARQVGIGETGRGYADRWQRIIHQEHDASPKRAGDDTQGVKTPSKIPKPVQPASDMPPSGAPRWTPPQGAAVGRFGPCAFPPQ